MSAPVAERARRWAAREADDDGVAEVASQVAIRFGLAALVAVAGGQLTCGLTDLLAVPLGAVGLYAAWAVYHQEDARPAERTLALAGGVAAAAALAVLLVLFAVFGSLAGLVVVGML